jgi:hypothetical protein
MIEINRHAADDHVFESEDLHTRGFNNSKDGGESSSDESDSDDEERMNAMREKLVVRRAPSLGTSSDDSSKKASSSLPSRDSYDTPPSDSPPVNNGSHQNYVYNVTLADCSISEGMLLKVLYPYTTLICSYVERKMRILEKPYPRVYVESKWGNLKKQPYFKNSVTFVLFNDARKQVDLEGQFYLMFVLMFQLGFADITGPQIVKYTETMGTSPEFNTYFVSKHLWSQVSKVISFLH